MTRSKYQNQDRISREERNRLVAQYAPHVKHVAHRLAAHLPQGVDVEDLINAGIVGLIQAADRYDPSRDNKFMTYAMFRIKGAILSELRSRDYLSRGNRKKVRELDKAYTFLEQDLGREPTEKELAKQMGVEVSTVREAKKNASLSFVSYEDLGYSSTEEKDDLLDRFLRTGRDDALSLVRLKELQSALAKAIDVLPEKEKLVVSLYYMEELTMKEAGEVLGITESRVSQIHSQAVIHLRERLRKENIID